MSTRVNLRELAIDRTAAAPSVAGRRHLLTRLVLPMLLLAGFVALVGYGLRESLSPPRAVTVIPVISSHAALDAPPDTPLFRAAGWVEPSPLPTLVTALAEGVVDKLLVVEGQQVKEGQVVARLVSEDARLALESAEAEVQLREALLTSTKAALVAATARLEEPIHLKVELADALVALATVEGEKSRLPLQLKTARARQLAARKDWDYRKKATGSVPPATLVKSRADLDAADAAVEELQAKEKTLPVLVKALETKRDALQQKLKRKTDEVKQVAEARGAVQTAEARLKQAKTAVAVAKLRLARMEIRAPSSGRVLALTARPGMRLSGLNPGSLHDSSTVLTLFDPASLQVRVDVRLDDVSKVITGQKARIESAALPGRSLAGRVLLATSQADIQKNTLSIKVAITAPPASLKPDMLCQVTFLAPPVRSAPGKSEQRLLIPRQLVEESRVWVVDQLAGLARMRSIELGLSTGDLVEVTAGLSPSDKLIIGGREGLKDGDRVRITGEDETLGIPRRR